MTSLFGTNDKLALNIFIVLVVLAIAAWVGIAARRNFGTAVSLYVSFGLIGVFAAIFAAQAAPLGAFVSALAAAAAGVLALRFLLRRLPARAGARTPAPRAAGTMPDWDRRRFLLTSGGFLGASLGVGLFGRRLLEDQHPAAAPVSAVPAGARQHRAGPRVGPVAVGGGNHPDRDPEQQVLPDRHGPAGAAGRCLEVEPHRRRHGRPQAHLHLRRPARDAALRAVRHDPMRQQLRRRRPRRQHQVDGRPPQGGPRQRRHSERRDPDRGSLGGRLHGRASRRAGRSTRRANR